MTTAIDALPDNLQGYAKTFTITYPAVVEALDGTPPDLPTSVPGSPQFSLTIALGDLPVIAPAPLALTHHALLYLAGQNNAGSSAVVSYEVYKDGVLVISYWDTVPDTHYWTLNSYVMDIAEGTLIEVFLSANTVGVAWEYQAYAIAVDQVQVSPTDRVLARISYDLVAYPVLADGTPSVADTGAFHIQHLGIMAADIAGDTDIASQVQRSSVYSGLVHYGHVTHTASIETHATDRPLYVQDKVLGGITFILTDISV